MPRGNRKDIGGWAVGIMRWVIIGAAVYAAALLLLHLCGVKAYIVMSGSMEPEIQTGSLCMVNRRASFDRIREGDVIAFETAGGMVTHRVVRKDGEWLETKGDANDISDGYTTTRENYRGETIFSVPYLGYLHFAVGRYRIALAGLLVLFTLYNGTREITDRNRGRFDEFLQKK